MYVARTGVRNAWWYILYKKDFRTHGSLKGTSKIPMSTGMLSGEDLDSYRRDRPMIDYVVVSYNTPIAWHTTSGEWSFVTEKFSKTTTSHLNMTRATLSA